MSKKASGTVIQSLKRKHPLRHIPAFESLHRLDLGGNSITNDNLNLLCDILAQPNYIKQLYLANSGCSNLEMIFGALVMGCASTMHTLDTSGNRFEKSTPPISFVG